MLHNRILVLELPMILNCFIELRYIDYIHVSWPPITLTLFSGTCWVIPYANFMVLIQVKNPITIGKLQLNYFLTHPSSWSIYYVLTSCYKVFFSKKKKKSSTNLQRKATAYSNFHHSVEF